MWSTSPRVRFWTQVLATPTCGWEGTWRSEAGFGGAGPNQCDHLNAVDDLGLSSDCARPDQPSISILLYSVRYCPFQICHVWKLRCTTCPKHLLNPCSYPSLNFRQCLSWRETLTRDNSEISEKRSQNQLWIIQAMGLDQLLKRTSNFYYWILLVHFVSLISLQMIVKWLQQNAFILVFLLRPLIMAFFSQIADALSLCSEPPVRTVRTTADPPMAPEEAMKLLKDIDFGVPGVWVAKLLKKKSLHIFNKRICGEIRISCMVAQLFSYTFLLSVRKLRWENVKVYIRFHFIPWYLPAFDLLILQVLPSRACRRAIVVSWMDVPWVQPPKPLLDSSWWSKAKHHIPLSLAALIPVPPWRPFLMLCQAWFMVETWTCQCHSSTNWPNNLCTLKPFIKSMPCDDLPGDIFVLRNAGNTCTHSEGSMVPFLYMNVISVFSHMIETLLLWSGSGDDPRSKSQGWKSWVCHRQAWKPFDFGAGPHQMRCHLRRYQDILGLESTSKEGTGWTTVHCGFIYYVHLCSICLSWSLIDSI